MLEILDVLFAYVLILLLRITAAPLSPHFFGDLIVEIRHFPEQPTTAVTHRHRWSESIRLFFQNLPILRNLLFHLVRRHALERQWRGIKWARRGYREAANIKTARTKRHCSKRVQRRFHPRRQRACALGAITQPTADDDQRPTHHAQGKHAGGKNPPLWKG